MPKQAAHTLLTRLFGFAAVSGAGLAIDFLLFLLLLELGLRAELANFISAATAVSFVYFVSVRHLFDYQGRFLLRLFLLYLAYQVLAVSAASWAIGCLVVLSIAPVLAKILILPLTFGANFLFMSAITRARVS